MINGRTFFKSDIFLIATNYNVSILVELKFHIISYIIGEIAKSVKFPVCDPVNKIISEALFAYAVNKILSISEVAD